MGEPKYFTFGDMTVSFTSNYVSISLLHVGSLGRIISSSINEVIIWAQNDADLIDEMFGKQFRYLIPKIEKLYANRAFW